LRLTLAGEGKPQGGSAGFELFDKTQFGESEFGEHLRYIRALQGELQRTIGLLDSVQSARVHLVLPERRLLTTEQQVPSASVLLILKHGPPTPKEVKTVIHLVSSAVEGLDAANVTVTDSMGDVLSELPGVNDDTAVETRMTMQHKVAHDIELHVQSMLDQVLGPNKALARAAVTMNFTRGHIENETYTPVTGATTSTDNAGNTVRVNNPITGVLESEQRTTENYNGEKATGAFGSPATGTALGGLTGNRSGNNNAYNRSESTTQYRVSKKIERSEVSPGQVERVSLAVLVDKSIPPQQVVELQKTIEAAAGLDLRPQGRGDSLSIQAVTFDTTTTAKADQEAAQQQQHAQVNSYLKLGGSILLVLVFLLVVWAMYRTSMTPLAEPVPLSLSASRLPALEEPGTYAMLTPPVSTYGDAGDQYAAFTPAPAPAHEAPPPNLSPEDAFLYQQLNPLRVAQVVKDMLAEDE